MTAFTVIPSTQRGPGTLPGVILQRDLWNDFGFVTQYHVYLNTSVFNGYIGDVKILRRGQKSTDGHQLELGPLSPLGAEFCSLGQSLDYYQRIAELPGDLKSEILVNLRDCVFDNRIAQEFIDEGGWDISLLRAIDWNKFAIDAARVLKIELMTSPELGETLTFHVDGWLDPVRLYFHESVSRPQGLPVEVDLPNRVSVLTGRNGSGKSTLLARLARVLHASQRDRETPQLQRLGRLMPRGIGFSRVLNISYSAFDAFQIPGVDRREREQIREDLKRGGGRYYFCGLRDIVSELSEGLDAADQTQTLDQLEAAINDRQHQTVLKAAYELAKEFAGTVDFIRIHGRLDLLRLVTEILARDPSFLGLDFHSVTTAPENTFSNWSTGHKFVMHAISSMIAHTQPKSIVLIDEPETHLHPPLLATFMQAIRLVLKANDAFAVIATHSPVVAQETLAKHISIVRRFGDVTQIQRPRIETYGESIGEITNEVFGLNADATDYHAALLAMVSAGLDLRTIESFFERGLSLQARAYVMSEIALRDRH